MIKDGWKDISDVASVYIEDGEVLRGSIKNGVGYDTARPFKLCKDGTYTSCEGVRWDTFRRGLKDRRYILH